MHVVATVILDPTEAGAVIPTAEIEDHLAARICTLAPFRKVVLETPHGTRASGNGRRSDLPRTRTHAAHHGAIAG